jgi:hypothetical protein
MMHWEAANGVTEKGFGELLKIVKSLLPRDNQHLSSIYKAKRSFSL